MMVKNKTRLFFVIFRILITYNILMTIIDTYIILKK